MKKLFLSILSIITFFSYAQVGIGTTNPQGQLDISSSNMGVVVPRVTNIKDVTDGNGNPAVNGTIVYDLSKNKMCYRIADAWICTGKDINGNVTSELTNPYYNIINYVKASNTDSYSADYFGNAISLSADGTTLAVGAYYEASNATGINGNQYDNSAFRAGAVYIYIKTGNIWSFDTYIKASNTDANDYFGRSVSLSANGTKLAVGAEGEGSNATGINGNEADNSAGNSGAVYIYIKTNAGWVQDAYIKASNTDISDVFGASVSLSANGTMLAVGAPWEDSNAIGINGNETDNSIDKSGAVYIFNRTNTGWVQDAYIKASNTGSGDEFGISVSLSGTGTGLVIGAYKEESNATGVNGNESDNSAGSSGAAYVFTKTNSGWIQDAYIKASNTNVLDYFGFSVSMSGNGNKFIVGAFGEDSNATGVNGNEADNSAINSGAAYVFIKTNIGWVQEAYIKASNTDAGDYFGYSTNLSRNGNSFIIGAFYEDSNATNFDGNESDNSATDSGAAYVFTRTNTGWKQITYLKASNTETDDSFGRSVSISDIGSLAVGAFYEDSNATGVGGNQNNNSAYNSGAVYIIE